MAASFTRRVFPPRRSSPPLLLQPTPPSNASAGAGTGATPVHLLLMFCFCALSANVELADASDRSLCFKMPPANTVVVKPELLTDAAKVGWRRRRWILLGTSASRPSLHAFNCGARCRYDQKYMVYTVPIIFCLGHTERGRERESRATLREVPRARHRHGPGGGVHVWNW